MDYCSACRRHLNGALVCPGCGACASPDLAPMPVRPSTYAVRRPGEEDTPSAASRHSRSVPPPTAPHPKRQPAEVPAGAGRAARRREQTRWRKTRRRAVLATAVALVGGGLTFAALNHQPTDRTRTTAAQGERPMGGTGPEATAGLPVPTPSPTYGSATPSGAPHTGAEHTGSSAPRSKAPTAPSTASPEPSESSKRSGSPTQSSSVLPHARSLLPLPHSTAPAPDSATPASPLAPAEQSPTPTRSTPTPTPDTTTDSTSATPSTSAPEQQSPSSTAPSAQSASPATSPSASPSSSHLCLLVLCLN
ncbi:SCO2400 family protein [Streptomyces sp. NPDC003660]